MMHNGRDMDLSDVDRIQAVRYEKALAEWKTRALKAEERLASLELVIVCATDIVAAWPKLTMRMFGSMTKSIDTLKQALAAVSG